MRKHNYGRALGRVLRDHRLQAGYTQRYIGKICDRDPSNVSRFERKGIGDPDLVAAYFIAMPERTDVILKDFIGGRGNKE